MRPPGAAAAAPPRECLAFRIGAQEYGVDRLRVREIRAYEVPTRIAGAEDCVRGVLNLRGAIVPIVDARRALCLTPAADDARAVVIVLAIGHRLVGLVVDAVGDVVALAPAQRRALPGPQAAEHLLAMGAGEGRLLLLPDIDKLVGRAGIGLPNAAPGHLQ